MKKRIGSPTLHNFTLLDFFLPYPQPFNQESRTVAGKLRDATVNFDRYGVCKQLFFFDTFRGMATLTC